MSWFKESVTDEKGEHDIVLLVFIFGVGTLIVLTALDFYVNRKFDPLGLGQALSWLTGGAAGGYGLKRAGEKYGTSVDVPK